AYTQRNLHLAGTAVDDGNPAPAHLVATWSLRAGAGTARFDDVHDLNTVVHFSWPGQYVLHPHVTAGELSASDEGSATAGAFAEGGEAEDQRSVFVDKNLKIGTFAFAVTDLTVPVPGLPVQVIRSYDSRDSRDGDFGRGWSLSISDVRLEKTALLGKFWGERIQGSYA